MQGLNGELNMTNKVDDKTLLRVYFEQNDMPIDIYGFIRFLRDYDIEIDNQLVSLNPNTPECWQEFVSSELTEESWDKIRELTSS